MSHRALFMIAVAALLVACQPAGDPAPSDPSGEPAAAVDSTDESPAGPPATPPMEVEPRGLDALVGKRDDTVVDTRITDVQFSDSGDAERNFLGAPMETFASDTPTVYAEVQTSGSAPEYTLYVKWLAPDGSVLSDYGIRQEGAGNQRALISLGKPDGWAPGRYRVEVAINSQDAKAYPFTVR